MAFNDKEQEIIKYGVTNGKSRQEVEQAIANYRAGIVPTPKVIIQPEQTSGVVDGVSRVASTYVKNLKEQVVGGINYGGEGLATQSENYWQALQSGNKLDQTKALLRGGLRVAGGEAQALLSPITAAISTGIQGWQELDKATGGTVTNQIKDIAQKNPEIISGISNYIAQNPEKVKDVQDLLNFIGGGVVSTESKALLQDITTGIKDTLTRTPKTIDGIPISKVSTKTAIKGSAYDLIKSSSGDLTQKAVDFISNDPGAKVETILKRSTPQELDNYLAIAQQHASSQESKHVFEVVGDKLSDTTKILDTKLKEIGKAKSDIVTPLREGLGAFKNETTPLIEKLTSLKNNFSEVDKGQKATVQAIINDAKTVATKRDADMFIDKVQNALYTGNMDMTIPRGSSLDKQLRGIIGEYNSSLKKSLPIEYTQLNDQYSKLIDTLDVINRSLGETVEGVPIRGASLIKQFFSPAGSKAKEIFEFIKKETNGEVDLAKDATLAKFAGQLYDDPNVNSLLGGIKDIPTTAGAVVGKVIEKVGGKQVTDALRSSTVRKAKSSTIPTESKATSMVDKKMPTESKLVQSQPNTTPKTFEELVDNAKKYQPRFKESVSTVAKNLGFDVKIGNPKLLKTFEDKKLRPGEENFTIKDAKDANRATILVNSPDDLSKVEKEIAKQFEISRIKNKFGDGYAYKSAIINVKTPAGHEAEIAITTPKMWEAKITEGDALYRVVRAGAKGWEEAEKKMLELYKKAN